MADEIWLLAIPAFAIMLALAVRGAGKQASRARALGEQFGWRPVGPAPRWATLDDRPLVGKVGRFDAQFRYYETRVGKDREGWTALELALRQADPRFAMRIQREGMGARLAKAFGGADVETGNPEFDHRFRIQASDEGAARRVLDPGVQLALPAAEPFAELRVEPGLALGDGTAAPAAAVLALLRGVGARPVGLPTPGHVAALRADLRGAAAPYETPLLRLVWRGAMLDAERVRAALPVLERLAGLVERRRRPRRRRWPSAEVLRGRRRTAPRPAG
ncbi:MAG TPA: hypothetical protein VGR28_05160 [Candidatus Thermoplasmatota archaeon]|nr:hypothetical protein [Candidatus Thermoplasmatota archaeon]